MILTSEELRNSFHYLFPDELPELKRLAVSLPDNPVIVNIGAGSGTSGLAFAEARPDATIYTIDVQEANSPLGCLYAERDVFKRAGQYYRLGDSWFQIHMSSTVVGRSWNHGPVDLVFIDGDHSYEGCRDDIKAWLPRIKAGGLLLVHDYNKQMLAPNPDGPHPMTWQGVNDAVDNFLMSLYPLVSQVDSLVAFRIDT